MNKRPSINEEKVREHVDKTMKDAKCSLCGKDNFSTYNDLFFYLQRTKPGENVLREGVPFLVLICDYCGNTYLIDAVPHGLLTLPDSEKEAQ